jgi:putative transposase
LIDILQRLYQSCTPLPKYHHDATLDNFLGVQAIGYNDRNANRTHKGFGQVTDTLESYFD